MNIRTQSIISLLLVLFCNNPASKAQIQENKDTIDNPSIKYGKLPNGFTYYIKPIDKPMEKLEISFLVKVGNYNEDMYHLDFAHAVEHLAFKSAKHFPANILNDNSFLQHLEMKKNDISAQTSNFYTIYSFKIPSHRKDALTAGFQFFQDIAKNLKINKKDVDNERGPLRQEMVFRQGGNMDSYFFKTKLESLLFPCLNNYSDFFEHNNNFSWKSLHDYYKKWYRPDLMAVVVIGKIEKINDIENQIQNYFSSLK